MTDGSYKCNSISPAISLAACVALLIASVTFPEKEGAADSEGVLSKNPLCNISFQDFPESTRMFSSQFFLTKSYAEVSLSPAHANKLFSICLLLNKGLIVGCTIVYNP